MHTACVSCAGSVLFLVAGCSTSADEVDWSTARVESVAPGSGVRWDWEELGSESCSPWGWQSFDRTHEDGARAGLWTTFPPRDFAVQVLGRDHMDRCERSFAEGATACSFSADGVDLVLGVDGSVNLSIEPTLFASDLRAAAKPGATRAVGDTVEWFEDEQGRHEVKLK